MEQGPAGNNEWRQVGMKWTPTGMEWRPVGMENNWCGMQTTSTIAYVPSEHSEAPLYCTRVHSPHKKLDSITGTDNQFEAHCLSGKQSYCV